MDRREAKLRGTSENGQIKRDNKKSKVMKNAEQREKGKKINQNQKRGKCHPDRLKEFVIVGDFFFSGHIQQQTEVGGSSRA